MTQITPLVEEREGLALAELHSAYDRIATNAERLKSEGALALDLLTHLEGGEFSRISGRLATLFARVGAPLTRACEAMEHVNDGFALDVVEGETVARLHRKGELRTLENDPHDPFPG